MLPVLNKGQENIEIAFGENTEIFSLIYVLYTMLKTKTLKNQDFTMT